MKNIIIALIIALCAPALAAQSKIDKVMKDMEGKKDVKVTPSPPNNGMYIFEFEDDNNESRYVLKRNQVSKQWKDKNVKDDTEKKGKRNRKSQDVATLDSYPDLYY